jgi:arylsulfatase A-like enzyme/Tfp pilus assembly protein PilF
MRKIILIVIIGAAVLGLFAFLGNRPSLNLVLISVDTLRPDHLGCYGYGDIRTPNIDRLAREGTRFTDVTSAVPLTLPSHATILTGLYPPSHGIRDNAYMALPGEARTLAETLRDRGYSTYAVVGAFVLDSRYGLDQGFDFYEDDLSEGRKPLEFAYTEITADAVTRKSVARLRGIEEPFFAFIHYYDPHTTYAPPEPYATTYESSLYDGEIAYTDQAIGRLIDYLTEEGLLERTLVVLLSDHGEGLGQHDEPTHGVLVYESTLQVPLIIRPPGTSDLGETLVPGSTVEMPVSLTDIYDSLLDMLGIDGDHRTEGESFLPKIGQEPRQAPAYYFESLYPYLAYRWNSLRGLRQGGWKYILAPREELYDLDDDPGETRNLAGREAEKAREMRECLVALAMRMEKERAPSGTAPDREEVRKLRALGYLSGGTSKAPDILNTEGADPKDMMPQFSVLMASGEDAFGAGDFETALENFSRIVAMDPGNPQAHVFRARTLRALGRLREARDEYLNVTRLDSTNSTPYFHLGNIAQGQGNLDEALEYYEQALRLVPGSPEALANIASIIMEKGFADSAEVLLRRALKSNPQNLVATLNLGLAYRSKGADQEALELFRRTLRLDPENVKAMVNIADIYAAEAIADSTIKYLETAAQVEPLNDVILANLGNAYRQKGLMDKAEEAYQAALTQDPEDVLALFGLAAVRAHQGRIAEAKGLLRQALEVQPGFTPARTALRSLSATP